MSWRAHKDGFGFSIGKYPDHEYDWQFSLCRVKWSATFLDIKIGQRHDWRIRWEERLFRQLLGEHEGWERWHHLGRLGWRNYAHDRQF